MEYINLTNKTIEIYEEDRFVGLQKDYCYCLLAREVRGLPKTMIHPVKPFNRDWKIPFNLTDRSLLEDNPELGLIQVETMLGNNDVPNFGEAKYVITDNVFIKRLIETTTEVIVLKPTEVLHWLTGEVLGYIGFTI